MEIHTTQAEPNSLAAIDNYGFAIWKIKPQDIPTFTCTVELNGNGVSTLLGALCQGVTFKVKGGKVYVQEEGPSDFGVPEFHLLVGFDIISHPVHKGVTKKLAQFTLSSEQEL